MSPIIRIDRRKIVLSFPPIPKRIEALIEQAISVAQHAGDLPTLDDHTVISIPVKPAKQSDYASPVAMAAAKLFRMKPLDIATAITNHLPSSDMIDRAEVAPPGFINFWLSQTWIRGQVKHIIADGDTVFAQETGQKRPVMVEFVSANPTGPIHIGRTRGAVVGDAIARVLEACGWKVHREYYFNNGGRQMEMLGRSLQARYLQALGQEVVLPEEGYRGDYLIEMAAELKAAVGDTWQDKDWPPFKDYAEVQNFKSIRDTLQRAGVVFDQFFNELDLYENNAVWETRDQLTARGHTYQDIVWEGADDDERAKAEAANAEEATWFRSTAFGDDQDRVIVRGNGDPTYVLPDIAYHVNKLERGFEWIIDVFGSDHFTEAQVVSRGLQALGKEADKIDVVIHQWVHLLKDGEKVGQSTRKGELITLDEIMDEIGPDAIRYFMLSRSTDNDVTLDLDLAVRQSNENPVFYIQNAHVRCAGILRQLDERDYPDNWDEDADLSHLGEEEMAFVLKMLELPEQLQLAHDGLSPHLLAFWALDLARAFHPMYDRVRVLHSDVPDEVAKARLQLYRAAKVVFKRVLSLMGMSAPEQM